MRIVKEDVTWQWTLPSGKLLTASFMDDEDGQFLEDAIRNELERRTKEDRVAAMLKDIFAPKRRWWQR
jgi:hypothetical protein